MGVSSLATNFTVGATIQAQNNLTPSAASPTSNSSSPKKTLTVGTAAANNAAGGGDEPALFLTTISASGSASIDFTNITDLMGTTAVTLARVKWIILQLLSAADDSVNGNACSSVTLDSSVTNGLTSQSHSGWFGNTTSTFDIPNGGVMAFGTPSAGGVVIDPTHKVLKATNNDGGVSAKFQTTLCGGST